MNIKQVAEQTGLPAKTIRYYEDIGLIAPDRGPNGYRSFGPRDVQRLAFLARARNLGFSLDECRRLMGLYCDDTRTSREVRDMANAHLAELREKIAQLREMESQLQTLVAACRGDDDPDCAILNDLARPPG